MEKSFLQGMKVTIDKEGLDKNKQGTITDLRTNKEKVCIKLDNGLHRWFNFDDVSIISVK
jgi:hypothetical protein